jgi:hypothetical protein
MQWCVHRPRSLTRLSFSTLSGLGIAKFVEFDYNMGPWPGLVFLLQMVICGALGAMVGASHKVGSCARAIGRVSGSGGPFSRAAGAGKQVRRSWLPPLPRPRLLWPHTQPLAASGGVLVASARTRAVAPGRLPAYDVTRACDDLGSAARALFAAPATL